jgi:hypothetical protein
MGAVAEYVVEFGRSGAPAGADGRLDAPAFHRNHRAIWSVLAPYLANLPGDVLELGSGTGQHAVAFAEAAPQLIWWPSDINDAHLASIEAWRLHAGLPNLRAPHRIDLAAPGWGLGPDAPLPRHVRAIFCANVVHIAPWRVAEGLFAGAGPRLQAGGHLFLYGPFRRDGRHTAPSNEAFDASLRQGNPEWGVRDIADLARLAGAAGMRLADVAEMPANNLTLIFERSA